ncbi:MAG: L,D-transpeptidase [Taibaiella sp.]|nr:L,D-transpeptidase [Taibaiella sp.]
MRNTYSLLSFIAIVLLSSCGQQQSSTQSSTTNNTVATNKPVVAVAPVTPVSTTYTIVRGKDNVKKALAQYGEPQKEVLMFTNRVDSAHLALLDSLVVPASLTGTVQQYSPYPQSVPYLKDIHKIIFFSYPAQVFGAYENGQLVRAGQTNMGREKDQTPTGLFYTNWKAEETKSTFNDEWDLKWNFNIQNKEGIGFHQYTLPGYPASHSCLRLTEGDAKYLYTWADEWIIRGTDNIRANGTPVVVFGAYPFGSAKPWMQLAQNAHALDISAEMLQSLVAPHLNEILAQQARRVAIKDTTTKK